MAESTSKKARRPRLTDTQMEQKAAELVQSGKYPDMLSAYEAVVQAENKRYGRPKTESESSKTVDASPAKADRTGPTEKEARKEAAHDARRRAEEEEARRLEQKRKEVADRAQAIRDQSARTDAKGPTETSRDSTEPLRPHRKSKLAKRGEFIVPISEPEADEDTDRRSEPQRKSREKAEMADGLKERTEYSEEVQLRLTNLIYDPLAAMLYREAGIDPDEAHLLSLTRINNSREAAALAQQITREAMYNRYVRKMDCSWPPSQIWRIAFLLARRSIPGTTGPGFMLGVGLAQEQTITKSEEAGEENSW